MKILILKKFFKSVILLFGIFLLSATVMAQEKSTEDLAKASQNPVSSLISVPFEGNVYFDSGPGEETDYVLNIKPVYPLGLTENWNLINRMIIPVKYLADQPFADKEFGLGDIVYQGFFSPAKPGKLIWGVGPMLSMPTGSDDRLTSDKWAAGPSVVALMMPGKWVIGGLLSNIWSFAGDSDAAHINMLSFQYFINYNMKGGWYLSMGPTITANWKADDSDNTWTVPLGGGFGRVFKIGKQPVNVKLAGYYNSIRPDYAPRYTVQAQLTFMFPK